MVQNNGSKRFSCAKCGLSFECYPPDDVHHIASIREKRVEDPIKVEYTCEKCGNTNTLFWGWRARICPEFV